MVFHRFGCVACSKISNTAILLDMMPEQEIGLDFVTQLNARFSPKLLIITTRYASIATTVAATKKGTDNYRAKPVGFAVLLYCCIAVLLQ